MGASGAAATAGASSVMLAILYGLAYLTAASSIILLNKHVLSVTPFHFPIALSSLGVLFGWVTSVIGVHTGIISLEKHKDITLTSWVKTVLPIGFFTGVTLACGNMAYFYLSLSFLQMTKARRAGGAVLHLVDYWPRPLPHERVSGDHRHRHRHRGRGVR